MAKYKIKIEPEAIQDIQKATDWYNEQLQGLGSRFQNQVIVQINSLKSNPSAYAVRYAEVRCMIIKKFPFMVHFTTDENQKLVEVFAIYLSGEAVVNDLENGEICKKIGWRLNVYRA